MIQTITSVLRECERQVSELGFVRKKDKFYRFVGDVYQTFTLEKIWGGREWRILFGVYPLCMKLTHVPSGYYYSTDFSTEEYQPGLFFEESENSYRKLIDFIKGNMIPFFKNAVSSDSLLKHLPALENVLRNVYRARGAVIEDREIGGIPCHLVENQRILYYLLLKFHQYDTARLFIDNFIEHYEKLILDDDRRLKAELASEDSSPKRELSFPYNLIDRNVRKKLKKKSIQTFKSRLKAFFEELEYFRTAAEMADSGNYSYFEEQLRENEENTARLLGIKTKL